ncbi:chemotaxis protein CheW [Shewanella pneumatophori]|uniref:Chemotaxis protein CheW n=1 Tax=Shewanella pneumatophori TaxID=314092 RepID=A0A9X1ZPI6_9GAMM|nr:chemotaxis protein CheW [Shewanella pneumatophori]MCL1139611.1 chemotaxis protein CheW [Shewanella pneumatophori]
MSKLVDEAVSDYFALLLTEPKADVDNTVDNKPFMPVEEPQTLVSRQSLEQLFANSNRLSEVDSVTTSASRTSADTDVTSVTKVENDTASELQQTTEQVTPVSEDKLVTNYESLPGEPLIASVLTSQVGLAQQSDLANSLSLANKSGLAENRTEVSANAIDSKTLPTAIDLVSTQALLENLEEEFQVLFFKVAGLTLAVPLVSLGGIVNLQPLTPLIGRPVWYKGVQQHRGSQLNVVDTGAWVMPEKYNQELAEQVNYQYVVALQDSNWGLSCESLVDTISIKKSAVNWRSQAGKRPWLAGVVKEQMCGILNIPALVQMLQAGLGHQDSIA